ncbi:MAG: adenine phosphoribosyltransferase [Armatimonadota bacterium]|nr:adenine phosphoribosyltransferase [Armatimonadota bacterium]
MKEEVIKELIRDVPDFPVDGIMFRDITPVLRDADSFKQVVCSMAEQVAELKPDIIVGIESRGFILGAPIALELGVGFVPVRKMGKLPADTIKAEYALEYGTNVVEIHKDAIVPGQRVVVVDDLLATGGTAAAAVQLSEELEGEVAGLVFLIELGFLDGRKKLQGYDVRTLVCY